MRFNRHEIPGSHRIPLPGAKPVGKADLDVHASVTLLLRPRKSEASWLRRIGPLNARHPRDRKYLSREELAAWRGADPKDLDQISTFAHANHLTILEMNGARRTVRLSGALADLAKAFGVKLQKYQTPTMTYRGRTGPVYVSSTLADIVEGVFGLDNRPIARSNFRNAISGQRSSKRARTFSEHFRVTEVMQIYDFPLDLDGTGQTIALIELNSHDRHDKITGAGYFVSDLKAYFNKVNLATPFVSAIGVAGGINMPGKDPTGDAEVTVDIEVVGTAAPGAKIMVYFAPDTDAGFINCLNAALHDSVAKPSVISISWGGPEDFATDQFLWGLNRILHDATALGVTVCCEAGDFGSADNPPESRDGQPHVEFPASSPFALACGGTKIIRSNRSLLREEAWNDGDPGGAGGGGVSNKFAKPAYQIEEIIPLSPQRKRGRGVPDVSGNAAGYRTIVRGKEFIASGTSTVAPLWAGLIARANQRFTAEWNNTVGFVNHLIYRSAPIRNTFREVIVGNNDIDGKLKKYKTRRRWNPCTGLGVPDASNLLTAVGMKSVRLGRRREI